MGNIVLASPRSAWQGALYGASTAATLPLSNLQRRQTDCFSRFLDPSSVWVEVDLGAAMDIRLVALIYGSASDGATRRIRFGATQDEVRGDGASLDTGWCPYSTARACPYRSKAVDDVGRVIDPRRHSLWWSPAPVTARWVRIDVCDADNPRGHFDLSALVVDDGFQPARNYAYGSTSGLYDPSRVPRGVAGQADPLNRSKYQRARFSVPAATRQEAKIALMDLTDFTGTGRPILVVTDPDDTGDFLERGMIWGLLSTVPIPSNTHFRLYGFDLDIEELLP